jgi:signal transduction histidine kinase
VRRRAPTLSLTLVIATCLLILLLGGEIIRGPFLALAMVLYAIAAARRTLAVAALASALTLMSIQGYVLHLEGVGSGNATAVALLLIICWVIGYGLQQRRAYTTRLRVQAASSAVTEERLRIARELHDVVAHSMTVVAVQAGFGEYVFDSQPAEAKAALGAIQTVTRDALTDMQRLLGVLRQVQPADTAAAQAATAAAAWSSAGGTVTGGTGTAGDDTAQAAPRPAPLAPAPGLRDLDRLVSTTAGAGVRVKVKRTGEAREIPAGTDLSAFRIVQEALTNVVKHSGASDCLVAVDYAATVLSVSVTDPGPCQCPPATPGVAAPGIPTPGIPTPGIPTPGVAAPGIRLAPGVLPAAASVDFALTARVSNRAATCSPRGAGHGIVGMAERVSLCSGQFSAGPLPGGGFGVRAHLPIPPEPPGSTPALPHPTIVAEPTFATPALPHTITTEPAPGEPAAEAAAPGAAAPGAAVAGARERGTEGDAATRGAAVGEPASSGTRPTTTAQRAMTARAESP